MNKTLVAAGALAASLVVAAAGCGSDGGSVAKPGPNNDPAAYCKLAKKVAKQESFPTVKQLRQFQELAPDAISEPIAFAAPKLIEAGDDVVAQFNAFGADDVEDAITEINAFETAECGIDHSDEDDPGPGGSHDVEGDAARVDVTATDFEFAFEPPAGAGRTSFVLTNDGEQAHFLGIGKLKGDAPADLQQALQDESQTEQQWGTKIAAGGGDDEAVTFDLEPGRYALVCFLPDSDGTPHAMKGMVAEFTVS